MKERFNIQIIGLFLALTGVFLYPIFLGKVFFPGDLLYQWPPWSFSDVSVLKQVLPVNNLLLGDPVTAFYPWFTFFKASIVQGIFPLWNPLVMAGAPFLANWQSGALALENLVFYFLDVNNALNVHVFLKIFLTLSFTYLFLRKLKLSKEASMFGAISYAFSAFFVVWLNWPQTRVAMWLPLILFTLEHLFEKPNFKRAAFVSLSVAAAVLAGHPGTLVLSMMIVFAFCLFRILSEPNERFQKILFTFFGIVLGFGVGALVILPGIEMMKQSYQFHQRGVTDYLKLSLGAGNMVLLIFPYFYGHLRNGIYVGPVNFNEITAYVGLLPLFLSFWAITFIHRIKKAWAFLGLALFAGALIYSIWPQALLYKLPLVDMQPTQRFIFILSFSLAVLGAFGYDAFFNSINDNKKGRRLAVLSIIFFASIALIVYKLPLPVKVNMPSYKMLLLFTTLPFLALFGVYIKNGVRQLKWLLLGLLIIDMFIFGIKLNTFIKKDYAYPKTAVTDYLKKDASLNRVLPLVDTMLPNSLMPYGLQDARGRDALISWRYSGFAKLMNDKETIPQLPNFVLPNKIDSQLIDFLNVKYVVSETPAGNTLPRRVIKPNGIVELYNGQVSAQTFKASGDSLAGVGILVGTFKIINNPAFLQFRLYDNKGELLRSKKIRAAYFRDNSYFSFYFKPLVNSKGKKYKFEISADGVDKKNHIALYMSGFDQYADGNHILNNQVMGGDMVFYLQYKKGSSKFVPVLHDKSLTVYRNKRAFARAFSVTDYVIEPSSKKAFKIIGEGEINLKERVVLNKKPVFNSREGSYKGKDKVEVDSYNSSNIKINASLPKKSLVVISDTYYPGWRAFVDGREAPVYIANGSFRAIAVNKGKHKIEMKYQPASFRIGLIISMFSLLLVMGFMVAPSLFRGEGRGEG